MRKIRLLIVGDSPAARHLIPRALSGDPAFEVAGSATNGRAALDMLPKTKPDLMLLELEMPVLNGWRTLHAMRKAGIGLPVVVLSAFTERYAQTTVDALFLGANDYALRPPAGDAEAEVKAIRELLTPKIKALCPWALTGEDLERDRQTPVVPAVLIPSIRREAGIPPVDIVAIGVSLGGPLALAEMLPRLPEDFPVPIVVVQHMPADFTKTMASRLARHSAIKIVEAADGDELRPGCVWIAPGGRHMTLAARGGRVYVATNQDPAVNFCRPSIDVLLRSVAPIYGANALVVILTGMGKDGFAGCANIRATGGQIIAQDEATSEVWGMPQMVVRAGLAEKTLPIGRIADELIASVRWPSP